MSLEVVIGPMFSGKSSYALSYVRRQRSIGKRVLIVKPDIDMRYSHESVLVTHDNDRIPCMLWDTKEPLFPATPHFLDTDCVVIEEGQFFKKLLPLVKWLLINHKKDVLVVGLDGDASQQIFGEVLSCIPWATKVTKLSALCLECKDGTLAPFTKRNIEDKSQVLVGGPNIYSAVCLKHLHKQ